MEIKIALVLYRTQLTVPKGKHMPSEKMKLIKYTPFHSVNREYKRLERKFDMSFPFHVKLLTAYSRILIHKLAVPKTVQRFITSCVHRNQTLVHIGLKSQKNPVQIFIVNLQEIHIGTANLSEPRSQNYNSNGYPINFTTFPSASHARPTHSSSVKSL